MNRETELRFSQIPEIHKPRSKFKVEFSHLTTMNAADFVPIFCEEILAGDTISLDMNAVIRMSTPLFPTMSNAVVDILFFYVPSRLLWNHWVNFWGENENAWYQSVEYAVPAIKTSDMLKFEHKSLADHLGLPCEIGGLQVNALPFRAYVKIWNDWMRDENLQQEAPMVTTDSDEYTDNRYAYLGGAMLKANKLHDRMTSALPAPQKGNEVLLPLGSIAPVYALSNEVPSKTTFGLDTIDTLKWNNIGTDLMVSNKYYNITGHRNVGSHKIDMTITGKEETDTDLNLTQLTPNNLWTDLTNATAATINELRQAFAIQRFYEAQARGGSRYIEFLKNIFGVTSPDARLQRSEFLGGKRIPLSIFQTVQTGATTETSPLGQTGAFSHTFDKNHYFTKSFTEGGYLLGMATIRYYHWYQQGIHKMFSRRKWTDFYIPQFANLGEEPIKMREIFATGTADDEAVFGYQERYAEYRMRENMITGELNSTYDQSLDAWHYGDYYETAPTLGADWIKEDKNNIDRTLAVESVNADQFIADFYFDATYVRQMPMYSVPGLIDHM